MDVTYRIREIKKTDDRDFVTLIQLYNENINPAIKTSPNEIQYWLDHFGSRRTRDTFWVLALYINNEPIGYSQMIYLAEKKVLFVDYCVISPHFRGRSFSEFIYLIRDFFIDKKIEINYYITEIVYYSDNQKPSDNSIKFIRLLKMSGFLVAKAPYSQPELGLGNRESDMRATLMVYVNGRDNDCMVIHKETYLELIRAIYYDHYIAWYKPFMTNVELDIYTQKIDALYKKIQADIGKKDTIVLNGTPYINQEGITIEKNNKSNTRTVLAAILAITAAYIIVWIISFIMGNYFQISSDLQFHNWIVTGVLALIMFICWLYWNGNISDTMREFLEKRK